MEEKNKHIRYYILFDNHTQGMMLHELLDKQGLPNRIAPAPRDTDGKAACGMALLIHPDDIDPHFDSSYSKTAESSHFQRFYRYGPEGNRTPVRKLFHKGISHHSHSFDIPSISRRTTGCLL